MSFAVDIETYPDLSMVSLLPEPKADKRIKDIEKIQANIEEKRQKQIEEMSLNPMFAKIACIGIYGKKGDSLISEALMGDEKDIISKFFEIIGLHSMIVTWNGKAFDFDVIIKRGMLYGLTNLVSSKLWRERYYSTRHVDLMQEFCGGINKFEQLDTVAKVYLGKSKLDFDCKQISTLIQTEEGRSEIAKYCLEDCRLTYELAEKFGFITE